MKIRKIFLLVFVQGSGFFYSSAQAPPSINPPNIIPAPPEAAAFARYGEIPVDYSTGVPSIQIPLYTLTSRKLQVPISLSYHASGIKVQDVATTVGLGWVINSGGLVTRTVLGQPDFKWDFPYNKLGFEAYVSGQPSLYSQDEAVRNAMSYSDLYADRYFFQLPNGESSIFRYNKASDKFISTPYSSSKIDFDLNAGVLNRISITSKDGIQFILGESSANSSYFNCWSLTQMISADKTDTIKWFYTGYTDSDDRVHGQVLDHGLWLTWEDPLGCYGYSLASTYNSTRTVSPQAPVFNAVPLIDSIVSSTTVIKYEYTWDRLDKANHLHAPKLAKVSAIHRADRKVIKEFSFIHSYYGSAMNNNLRLRLDSVNISASDALAVERYAIEYDNSYMPPYSELENPINHEDYWGYYNGTSSTGFLPAQFVPSGATYNNAATRGPDPDYAKACLIKEIHYPTGGKTVFEFEPNYGVTYVYPASSPVVGNGGGFRIQNIKNYTDDATLANTKTYTYEGNYGPEIRSELFEYDQKYIFIDSRNGCNPHPVEERYRKVLISSGVESLTFWNTNSCYYTHVTEYEGTEEQNSGKTVYTYYNPGVDNFIEFYQPNFKNIYQWDRGQFSSKLDSRGVYMNSGGTYIMKAFSQNLYGDFKINSFNTGLNIFQTGTIVTGLDMYEVYNNSNLHVVPYGCQDTKGLENIKLLTRSTNYSYDNGGTLSEQIDYEYNPDDLLLANQTVTNSKGDILKTEFKYAHDFPLVMPYSTMISRNIIEPVIETKNFKNGSFLTSSKTNYYDWGSNIIAPKTIETKILSANAETRMEYLGYDSKANILSMAKSNDVKRSYIWDYKGAHVIAECVNADMNSIAYTSFEAEGTGNWTLSGGSANTSVAITGKRSYELTSGNTITRVGLNASAAYVVSYWSRSGSLTINGGNGTAGPAKSGWTLYEHRVVNPSSGTITLSGTAVIDELRLYPQAASMTSYTFEPLIGVSSQSDINNRITYYEYDHFNRLSLIRDADGNIIKKVCYNYAGQPENCF